MERSHWRRWLSKQMHFKCQSNRIGFHSLHFPNPYALLMRTWPGLSPPMRLIPWTGSMRSFVRSRPDAPCTTLGMLSLIYGINYKSPQDPTEDFIWQTPSPPTVAISRDHHLWAFLENLWKINPQVLNEDCISFRSLTNDSFFPPQSTGYLFSGCWI